MMKRKVFIWLFFLPIPFIGYAQKEKIKLDIFSSVLEEAKEYREPLNLPSHIDTFKIEEKRLLIVLDGPMLTFPGGESLMRQFIAKNMIYPSECVEKGIEGRVLIRMVIEKDGSLKNAQVVNSVHPLLDAEALRVVKAMPDWNVPKDCSMGMEFTLPIIFRLNDDK